MQIISLIALVIMLFDLKKVFGYSIREIFLSIRFDFEEFSKTKEIAISSFIGMIGWVIFYEIDIVILARFFPLNQLSFYSISLIVLSLFRTFTGILFGSFSNRINNLYGNNDLSGYYNFSKIFLYISSPIVLYATFSYLVLSDFFILHWVGINYIFSSSISQFLVLGYSLSFISYISSSLLLSQNRIKESLYISLFQPIIYWGSVYLLYRYFGLITVAFMKFIVLFISDVIYIRYLVELAKITYKELFYKIFFPFIIVSLFLYPVLILFVRIFHYSNSRFILLYLAIYVSIILIISVFLHLKIAKVNLKFLSKVFINGNHI
jgi:O-antigen/teichoic acid export membrane protein